MFEYNTVEEAVKDLQDGKLILVSDDESRENEGDLICAAEFATTENVNFMATYGKGLICMPMSGDLCRKLGLTQMVADNTDNHETAFTVSIDHVKTTTGISAEERGFTARECVSDEAKPEDFRRPGHMFPLRSKPNGVLERNGHTEATVDLCRLAGLKQCGLCCEIMREDGTMMRTSELRELAGKWNLKFITIKDIQNYRKCHDILVDRVTTTKMPTRYGEFMAYGFVNRLNGEHHVAVVKGERGDGKMKNKYPVGKFIRCCNDSVLYRNEYYFISSLLLFLIINSYRMLYLKNLPPRKLSFPYLYTLPQYCVVA